MWGISMLALIFTAVMLQFMPDSVPMHYNMAGEINRWGSKYENLLFPIVILALSLFWHLFILHYEKKAIKSTTEKESAEARSNAKVIKIVGVSIAAMFTVMQGVILFGAYKEATAGAAHSAIDISKVSCILCGILFIVLGNFMPKTKKNHTAGVRISWSMYNDTTWIYKSRRCFGNDNSLSIDCNNHHTDLLTQDIQAGIIKRRPLVTFAFVCAKGDAERARYVLKARLAS